MLADTAETPLIQDLLAALNAHDADGVAACHADEYRGTDLGQMSQCCGPDQVRREMDDWLRAFPDMEVTVHELVVDAEHVAIRWTMEGTHRAPFMRVPPTRRRHAAGDESLTRITEVRCQPGRGAPEPPDVV